MDKIEPKTKSITGTAKWVEPRKNGKGYAIKLENEEFYNDNYNDKPDWLEKDKTVTVHYTENEGTGGKLWKNISKIEEGIKQEGNQTVQQAVKKQSVAQSVRYTEDEKQSIYIRQTCINASVEFAKTKEGVTIEAVLQIANLMEDWINDETTI